ncbi:MAG: M50 family metallopeptidase [Clostridiaceae bacterium]|nr:M50 family metallopeptidase [Eubacteriales bacterium]
MLLLIFFAFISDNLISLLLAFTALSLHEICHALMARGLGYEISAIEFEPFGFVARLRESAMDRWDELLIASAGPLFSLVAGMVFLAARSAALKGFPYFEEFGRINLWIAAVNLLPALPLDGGRAAKAALSAFLGEKSAVRLLGGFGMAAGLTFAALGIGALLKGKMNLTLLVWGLFLPFAALREIRTLRAYRLSAMIRRSASLKSGGAASVRYVAVHRSLRAREALKLFGDGRYVALYVVDDDMRKLGELDEASLLFGLSNLGQEAILDDILKRH